MLIHFIFIKKNSNWDIALGLFKLGHIYFLVAIFGNSHFCLVSFSSCCVIWSVKGNDQGFYFNLLSS